MTLQREFVTLCLFLAHILFLIDCILFFCGCTLQEVETEEGHILKSVFVRKNLTCEVNMELTYYSAGFDPVCFYCGGVGKIIFKLQKISIQSVTCVCLVIKHLSKKGAAWQEKKRLNELFESCLFSKAIINVFGPLHDNTVKLTIGTSQVFCPVLV